MELGVLGSFGDGMMQPLSMLVLGDIVNSYGGAGTADSAFSSSAVDKVSSQPPTYVPLSHFPAWAGGVLRHVRAISPCALHLHARRCRARPLNLSSSMLQLPNVLANMTLFFGALVVSFVFAWRLALAGLPFTLLFVAPSVVLGKRMAAAAGEARAAYEEAGGVAEQAVSSIRTVVSYRGERQTLERFGRALARSTALGIKQGLIKGAVIGSLGIMYAVWSFMSWIGSVLVIRFHAQGGHVFVASICIILAGM